MEQSNLITQAFNLTLFGMGFVFLFLALLVLVTKLMSVIIQSTGKPTPDDNHAHLSLDDELDEETKFVIEEAIKMHRGA